MRLWLLRRKDSFYVPFFIFWVRFVPVLACLLGSASVSSKLLQNPEIRRTSSGKKRPGEEGGGRDCLDNLLPPEVFVRVRNQAKLLLGRLDVLGPGAAAAALRRNNALLLERRWAQQRRADALSTLQGRSILRRGHFKME